MCVLSTSEAILPSVVCVLLMADNDAKIIPTVVRSKSICARVRTRFVRIMCINKRSRSQKQPLHNDLRLNCGGFACCVRRASRLNHWGRFEWIFKSLAWRGCEFHAMLQSGGSCFLPTSHELEFIARSPSGPGNWVLILRRFFFSNPFFPICAPLSSTLDVFWWKNTVANYLVDLR